MLKNFMFACIALAALAVAFHFMSCTVDGGTPKGDAIHTVAGFAWPEGGSGGAIIVTEKGQVYTATGSRVRHLGELPPPKKD